MRKYVIEREIPEVGTLEREQLAAAAAKSNEVLAQLGSDIQWVNSYVAGDRTFCIYLAKDEDIIRKHAEISGFPATRIVEVRKMIDPTTEKNLISAAGPRLCGSAERNSRLLEVWMLGRPNAAPAP